MGPLLNMSVASMQMYQLVCQQLPVQLQGSTEGASRQKVQSRRVALNLCSTRQITEDCLRPVSYTCLVNLHKLCFQL